MKTLLIVGIGIWGFMAIINYYGRPAVEQGSEGMDKSNMKNRFNTTNCDNVKKNATVGKPQFS